jgi:hypothetical protein
VSFRDSFDLGGLYNVYPLAINPTDAGKDLYSVFPERVIQKIYPFIPDFKR